jgi:hypothetical protein
MVELLATMVLLGMIMVLMSGALSQVSQVLRVSDEAQAGFLPQWRSRRLLSEVVSQWTIDPQRRFAVGLRQRDFVGDEQESRFNSLALPWAMGQSQSAVLRVQREAEKAALVLAPYPQKIDAITKAGVASQETIEIAYWEVPVVLRYVDASGLEHGQWPPTGLDKYKALPVSLRVRQADGSQSLLLAFGFQGHQDLPNRGGLADTLLGVGR